MQKLHLVGFTTDHRSLILSVRRGARSGRYVLDLDDKITASVTEAITRRAAALEDASSDVDPEPAVLRPQSALSVRELQTRLRAGRSVEEVAAEAGVEPEWVERFAPPVLAEQARVIQAARAAHFERSRLGSSGLPLGTAVYRNLVARGVRMTADELDNSWTARQGADGGWLVTLTYSSRGRRHQPTWELEGPRGPVRADDRLAAELAYVAGDPPAGLPVLAKHAKVPAAAPTDADRQAALRVAHARREAEAQLDEAARAASKRNAERARRGAEPLVAEPPPSSPAPPTLPAPPARNAAKHAARPAEPAAEPVVAATAVKAPTAKRPAATPRVAKATAVTATAVTALASTGAATRPTAAKRPAATTRKGPSSAAKKAAKTTTAAKRAPVKPPTKPAKAPAAKVKPVKTAAAKKPAAAKKTSKAKPPKAAAAKKTTKVKPPKTAVAKKTSKAKPAKTATAKKTTKTTRTTKPSAKARPGGSGGSGRAPVLRSDLADRGGPNGSEGTPPAGASQHRRREPLRAR